MGTYIDQTKLEKALTPSTVAIVFADPTTGAVDTDAIELVIDRAEGEAESYLIGFLDFPLAAPNDRLMLSACLTFATALSYDRNPEYVRRFAEGQRTDGYWTRGKELMLRIQAAVQKLPDQPNAERAPANTGGIITDGSQRMMIASADGTQNGDGY